MTDVQYAPLRLCDSCGAVDDHPRHVYGVRGDQTERVTYTDEQRKLAFDKAEGDSEKLAAIMRDMMDAATQVKHLDCCLTDGCPDGLCTQRLNDPDDPFDGGKTVGPALSKKLAARVDALKTSKES